MTGRPFQAVLLALALSLTVSLSAQSIEITGCTRTSGGDLEISWASEPGKTYTIMFSEDMHDYSWMEKVESQGTTTTWQKSLASLPNFSTFKIREAYAGKRELYSCWIKRLPEIDYVWGSSDPATEGWPAVGEEVTWRAYVKTRAEFDYYQVPYAWYIDGVKVADGYVDVPSGDYATVDLPWLWTFDRHEIEFVIDHTDSIEEWTKENNSVLIYSDAITVGLYVEQSVYDYFYTYQPQLSYHGSNSWERWAQRQVTIWNELCEDAAYFPDAPEGVLDRFRIDHIHVVPDDALPLAGGYPTNHPNYNDRTVDLQWGFPSTLLDGTMYSDHTSQSMDNPFFYEKSLLHELGHARYLIDCYGFDTHNTAAHGGYDAVQIYEGSTYVGGSAYMPFIAWDEVLYYNTSGGIMSGPWGYVWSPYETMALNLIAGHRAWEGNYNSPQNIGVFLQDLPQNNHVRIMQNGFPVRGANVRIYEAESGVGWYGKTFDDVYDQEYTTDNSGYIDLPRNPFNPDGAIIHRYGTANGVVILRIQSGGNVWYRFMEVSDFNMEYWRGNTTDAYYDVEVD